MVEKVNRTDKFRHVRDLHLVTQLVLGAQDLIQTTIGTGGRDENNTFHYGNQFRFSMSA